MTRLGARSAPLIRIGDIERAVELISYRLTSEAGETLLTSAFEGDDDRPHWLEGEAYQNTATGALWRYASAHSGEDAVFIIAPNGNADPTPDAPHYAGHLTIGPRPDLGGTSTDRLFRFAFTWRVSGEPVEFITPEELAAWEAPDDGE